MRSVDHMGKKQSDPSEAAEASRLAELLDHASAVDGGICARFHGVFMGFYGI